MPERSHQPSWVIETQDTGGCRDSFLCAKASLLPGKFRLEGPRQDQENYFVAHAMSAIVSTRYPHVPRASIPAARGHMLPRKDAMRFTHIPAWVMPNKPSRNSLWEVFAKLRIEDQWVRLSADDQRAVMGFAPFGRLEFCVMEDGDVIIRRRLTYGRGYEQSTYQPEQVRRAITLGLAITPCRSHSIRKL